MTIPRHLPKALGLMLLAAATQSASASFVNWEYCGTGLWTSNSCWGGFGSPDFQDQANIRPGSLFNNANVLILEGDVNAAKDVVVTTNAVGDTSTVSHSGGSLAIGTDYGETIGWFGGEFLVFSGPDSGAVRYLLSGGSVSSRVVFLGSEGTLDATFIQSGGINTTEQLQVGQAFSLRTGKSTYQLAAGTLNADSVLIGSNTAASFIQAGGSHNVTEEISLGASGTGEGFYRLEGGSLTADLGLIGSQGRSTFDQSGGNNVMASELILGNQVSGEGVYTMSDGTLSAPLQSIGWSGTGLFIQEGGTNTATSELTLAIDAGAEGTYALNDGTLRVNRISSYAGSGTFNLNGGTLDLTGSSIDVELFNIGNTAGSNGELTLGAGQSFLADRLFIGYGGTGTIIQSGGSTIVRDDALVMGYYSENVSDYSAYVLSGGDVTARNLIFNRCFPYTQFLQSGGGVTIEQTLTLAQFCGTAEYYLFDGRLTVGEIVNGTGTGNIFMSGGVLQAGTIAAQGLSSFAFTGGTLMVDYFLGTLNNQGGLLSPGASPFVPASASITGDYSQSATGQLHIELQDTAVFESDTVAVNGTATLAGSLQATWISGSGGNAAEGDSSDILTAETITGSFTSLDLPSLPPGLGWAVNVLENELGSTDVLRLSVIADVIFEDRFE